MPGLSDQLLSQLSERVAAQMGWHFPKERWRELESGICSVARQLGIADAASYARELVSAPLNKDQIAALAGELTIGETYFFRDKACLKVLSERILPELIAIRSRSTRRLRIWSAGCCTGEEPYTIAILLDRLLPDPRDWNVTILATDVNARFLGKATAGTFREWSFRDAPDWLQQHYFRPVTARTFEILPRIKQRVTFAYLNLGADVYPSLANDTNAMDLILCRNVLMYFERQRARKVIDNFHRALMPGGWLVVSAVDVSSEVFSQFETVSFEGAILYRKSDALRMPPWSLPVSTTEIPSYDFGVAASSTHERVSDETAAKSRPQAEREPTAYQAASMLFEQGRYAEAARRLESEPSGVSTVDRAMLMARIHANLGELAVARQWAEKAIVADKVNAAAHYLLAVILQEQGCIEEALASLKRTLYLAPDFILAHFALGNLARRQNKRTQADRHFVNALELLQRCADDQVLPHSDGLAAKRLKETILSVMQTQATA